MNQCKWYTNEENPLIWRDNIIYVKEYQSFTSNSGILILCLQPSTEMPVQSPKWDDRVRDPEGGDGAQPLHRPAQERPAAGCGALCRPVPAVVCTGLPGVCGHGVLGHY